MTSFRVGMPFTNSLGETRWPVISPNGKQIGVDTGSKRAASTCAESLNADPDLVRRYTEQTA